MSEGNSPSNPNSGNQKLLENPVMSSLMVPIAIVLVGALIIFGVTKMLSTEQSYKDLVRELNSKTFGNRWISAFELSKLISSKQIPEEDIPWMVENLSATYRSARDPRTKEFLVVALGALRTELALPTITLALKETQGKIPFHALVALGNIPGPLTFDWSPVLDMARGDDIGLAQSALLVLATHRVPEAEPALVSTLTRSGKTIQYSAAMGLINYKNEKAKPLLTEILNLKASNRSDEGLVEKQVENLKLNLMNALQKNSWKIMNVELENVAKQDPSLTVQAKAREVLNVLKN